MMMAVITKRPNKGSSEMKRKLPDKHLFLWITINGQQNSNLICLMKKRNTK